MAISLQQTFDPEPKNMHASRNGKTVTQYLALYFRNTGKFSIFFPVVFQPSTGEKARKILWDPEI